MTVLLCIILILLLIIITLGTKSRVFFTITHAMPCSAFFIKKNHAVHIIANSYSINAYSIDSIANHFSCKQELLCIIANAMKKNITKHIECLITNTNMYVKITIRSCTRNDKIIGVNIMMCDISNNIHSTNKIRNDKQEEREESEMLQYMIDNMPYPIWRRNKKLSISYCNDAYLKLVNCNKKETKVIPELCKKSLEIAQYAQTKGEASAAIATYNGMHNLDIKEILHPQCGITFGFGSNICHGSRDCHNSTQYIDLVKEIINHSSSAISICDAQRKIVSCNASFRKVCDLGSMHIAKNITFIDTLPKLHKGLRIKIDLEEFIDRHISLLNSSIKAHNEFFCTMDNNIARALIIPYPGGGLLFSHEITKSGR